METSSNRRLIINNLLIVSKSVNTVLLFNDVDDAKVRWDAEIYSRDGQNGQNLLKSSWIIFREGCERGTKLNRARTISYQEEAPGATGETNSRIKPRPN
jgi:hypothetical protein